MEQRIEGAIDQGLESISGGLYPISVLAGILLILSGLVLLYKNRSVKKKGVPDTGFVCLALGAAALISGIIQM